MQPRDDVMLHLSVRPQENVIVRNHMKDQIFGAEERHGGNPIQAHQSFEIAITAEHSQYRISVNGNHFCTFTHRLPLHLVKFVSISGTCTISHIISDQSGGSTVYPPSHVHPVPPSFPVHHHPPAPPPMPPMAPPPYPGLRQYFNFFLNCSKILQMFIGFYPGHQPATPYMVFKSELQEKLSHLKHHDRPYHY